MTNMFIREVPKEIRPRERLVEYGAAALSNQELLAILFRTGQRGENVLEMSLRFLSRFESLPEIKGASLEELTAVKGIGEVKAIELKAAIELGYRIATASVPKYGQVLSTEAAGQWLMLEMAHEQQELLVALFLNTKNEIIRKETVFKGTVSSSVAHPREIFKEAVKYPTARIIMAHNHPSGDPEPSRADLQFTRRMILCGDLMGIELLDHIIVGERDFVSLLETTDLFDDPMSHMGD
ncbi:hypothetical protein CL176_04730 [Suicoccus acidiformans]|uniref:MPN domain-containing protein n=2 Tax=Suicoccus acidiformans TaxID=2036206 RepID=A0A347WJV2_9LACT|nr:DNA repair protein RadC [Suicoccus acidiformans]AXY25359.1 hypothetical protein CL176_04730 [Suicoccus acidiformans]